MIGSRFSFDEKGFFFIDRKSIAEDSTQGSPGFQSRTSATISVAHLLDIVNNSYSDILPQPVADHYRIQRRRTKLGGSAKYSLSVNNDIDQFLFDDNFYSIYEKEDRNIINKSEAELQAELKAINENYTDEYLVGEAKKRKLEDYKSNPQKYERLYEEQQRKIEQQKQLRGLYKKRT